MSLDCNPLLVEVLRGAVVESRHRGAAIACDSSGAVLACWGDVERPVFPRSAIKPIQALPLVETGALDAFGLGSEHLALACASHSAEPMHVERVRDWLTRIGLSEADLECGGSPSPLYNNCSGKHAGFLTVARHLGMPTRGYILPDHPVQQLVTRSILALAGVDEAPWGVDGCGIPTFALPLASFARAMARMTDPQIPARRRVLEAMMAHPSLVAGTGRLCTRLMDTVPGLVAKGGAEGVYAAVVPARGLGIALKIDDGAGRAAEVAVITVLRHIGICDARPLIAPVTNVVGRVVGEMRGT